MYVERCAKKVLIHFRQNSTLARKRKMVQVIVFNKANHLIFSELAITRDYERVVDCWWMECWLECRQWYFLPIVVVAA